MRFFDFLKPSKAEERPSQINEIAEFSFIEIDDSANYRAIINSKINNKSELLFPVNGNKIST